MKRSGGGVRAWRREESEEVGEVGGRGECEHSERVKR